MIMPEGPELKLSADTIRPLVINKRILNAFPSKTGRYSAQNPKGFVSLISYIEKNECRIMGVSTRGKFMYWKLTDDWYMFCTFGMTGQLSPYEGKHPCFGFYIGETQNNFETIYFNDPRHFGTIQFVQGVQELNKKLNELGWDPLLHGMDEKWVNFVINTCAKKKKPIGQLLMDQKIFAGVGNYIRAEALYLAQMSPWRQANLLKKEEIKTLCQAIVDVMNESYQHQGATILTYKDAYGAEGRYSSCFKVYGQVTDPLGNKIIKEETPEGRTIHWCPTIQV